MKYLVILFLPLHLLLTEVSASNENDYGQFEFGQCLIDNAQHYKISTALLLAIIKTESNFDPNAINVNTSGSEDVGIMQINSEWIPKIKSLGYDRVSLFDPCTNIRVGSWILAQEIYRFGYTWEAVGAFNAGPSPSRSARRAIYANRVFSNLAK